MDLLDSVPYLVWLKARPSEHPDFRVDRMGHLIKFSDYLNKQSPYGWEMDYLALPEGGHNGDINNLEVLNCQAVRAKRNRDKEAVLTPVKGASISPRSHWFSDLLSRNNLTRQLGWGAVKIETC
ncbi:MAG: hypothetical protein K5Q00_08295 [Gammaproteobacteria bacterium]|nr:hypothetical protein [Gammaproteobacteria bacterium]